MFVAVLLVCGTACNRNQSNKEPEDYATVEQKPMFNGEDAGKFGLWVFDQIKYPEEAYKSGAQGRVTLQFVISKKGDIKDMKYYLAIDIGASSGRHILGSIENGKIVTREIYRFEND